ncbi:STAS/SEC14 domain-containing protein [Vibrio sp.]|uniref:STAS/SEC14 domain-containing protein n=1 Tax=Vibrio sp. TaxID=678 RepID=UPI003D0BA9AC
MTNQKHGFSVGIDRIDDHFFLSFKAVGTLTHHDYQTMVPMVENALAAVTEPRINVFFDATELEGFELRAAWDDVRFGLKHGAEFERIALLGNKRWQELAAKLGGWFTSGEVEFFDNYDEAISWLEK